MSLALYRKYRPSIFADVIGQEHVTTPLSNALESGKIHHAYLFFKLISNSIFKFRK